MKPTLPVTNAPLRHPLGKLLSVSMNGAVVSIARLAAGFVRNKYVAVTIGTAGIGLISQANQFQLLAIILGSFAMSAGATNHISAARADPDPTRLRRVLGTIFSSQLIGTIALSLVGLIFSRQIAVGIFGITGQNGNFRIVVASIPFAVLSSSYIQSVFIGSDRYDLFMRATLYSTLGSIAALIPLVKTFGLQGAFLSIFVNSALMFVFFARYARKLQTIPDLFRLRFDLGEFRSLLRFCMVSFVTGAATFGVTLWIRRQVLATLGASVNGILQVPLAFTAYYTPFVTDGLWNRFYPAVSANGHGREAGDELEAALRLTAVLQAGFATALILLDKPAIRIAYSSTFLTAAKLLPAFFFGDFCYFITFVFGVYLLGIARLRIYLFASLAFLAIQFILSLALLPRLGVWAVALGYGVSAFASMAVGLFWFARNVRSRTKNETLWVVFGCGLLVAVQSLVSLSPRVLLRLPVPACICIGVLLYLFLSAKRNLKGGAAVETSP